MGTHIVWRNPSPPRKRELLVSRVARNHAAAVYQVITPAGSKRLFQLLRSGTTAAAAAAVVGEAATAMASPGAGLVSARW